MSALKNASVFLVICLLVSIVPAFSAEMIVAPVDKGDTLIYQTISEVQDENGDTQIFSQDVNGNIRIKKTVSEQSEIATARETGMKYGIPLKVGVAWGKDPEYPRSDNMYSYFVEKTEDVTVPAGTFKNCFKIVYETCPDTTIEWYSPGIGVVKTEYRHHGAVMNETVELAKIVKTHSN